MRPDSLCGKISAKINKLFCKTTGWSSFSSTLLYLDLDEQLRTGHEICDSLENAASEREIQDLTFVIHDKIQYYLMSTAPDNLQESDTQQLRRLCLEIIQKIPNGDHLRPFARSLLEMLFKLVEVENEENVLVCVKLIIDIHKFYRPSFSNDVSRFLDFVKEVYSDLRFRANKIFEPRYHILPKSGFSLKVMQEIPILVVLMYQLFKQHIHQDVSDFIPLIMDFINLKPTEEQKKNANFCQEVFIDFMAAQVKTLSFLAYVIKIYQDLVELHSVSLVQGMMNLLVNCPPSVTNMRKEFFIAARHILSAQEIRPKFLQVLDELMNEEILIGQGYTIRDALRPLAYSTLADLTHHIRSSLSLSKIARAIDVYGRNMHDHTLPFSIQQMSLRLILNLVECIRQRAVSATSANQGASSTNAEDQNNEVFSGTARRLLLQTLHLCVLKAKVVADHYIPALESTCVLETGEEVTSNSAKQRPRSIHAYLFANISSFSSELNEVGSFTDKSVPASDFSNILNSGTDASKVHEPRIVEPLTKLQLSYTDVRTLVKALITGIRTVMTSMIQCPHDNTLQTNNITSVSSTSSKQSISNRILSPDELVVVTEYFSYGMRMIDIVQFVSRDGRLYLRSQPSTKSPDERLLIETFALTFAQLNPISFHEIFSCKIHDYVVWCNHSASYTNIALHLLSQPNKTSYFGYILLSYLVDRLERLGDGTNESALYMRLLKLCFSSVNMSGTENELVMKIHLRRIVQGSMHYCLTAKEPTAYLTLLRTLFRSIGGGAHDKLYLEFFPLLPEMLTTLNRLLRSPHRSNARDLLGELCVIVPVRLSTLLPYLSLLMEPLVYVLNCNTVNQGLRTLELCVDNMQPDFLHDHLYQVRGDMLLALYNSLHSPSEYVQKMSFKVLGKLGRFNRTNLLETQRLRISSAEGEAGPQLRFHMNEFRNQPIDIPIRCLVDAAVEVLQDSSSDEPSKLRSWEFLQSICVAALNLNHLQQSSVGVEDFYYCFLGDTGLNNMILQYIDDICLTSYSENPSIQSIRPSCCIADDLCNHVMIMTIAGLFLAGLSKELYNTHGDFFAFIVRHATFLSIMQQFTSLHTEINRDHISCESKTLCKVDAAPKLPFSNDVTTSGDGHFLELDIFSISQDPDTLTPTANEPQSSNHEFLPNNSSSRLNPNIIIDSIMFVMGHEAKQLTRNMCIFLEIIHNTAFAILSAVTTSRENSGDHFTIEMIKKAVANLQIFQHIGHVIVDMLYHPAWYVKWGACASILYLARFIHPSWFCSNLISLLRGLLYCIHSLSNQMNQGALMMARDCTRIIISMVVISLKDSNETNHSSHSTVIEEEDVKSGKSTPVSTRKRSSTTSQRRTVQVRRGRSAANTTSESLNSEASTNVVDEPMEIDDQDNEKEFTPKFSSSLTALLDAVIIELLDSLLSETDSVRTEARCLLRLLAYTTEQPLCKLLAPHWYKRIGHVLPPKQPNRLLDLPISTQLAVLYLHKNSMSCKNEYIHETAFSCLREFISKTSIDIELRHANMKQIVQNIRQNSIRCIHTVRQLAYCAQLFPSTLSERLCDAIYSHLNTSLEAAVNKQNSASISTFTSSNLELCTLLLDLFHLIPLATSKYVSLLIESVVNAERLLNIEPTSPLRLPLTRFLSRYPAETCALLLTGSRWPYNSHANRIFLFALSCSQGQPIVDYLRTNYHILMDLIQPDEISDQKNDSDGQLCLPQVGTLLTFACPRHLAVRAVHTIHKISLNWLTVNNVSSNDLSKNNSRIKSNQSSVVWETKYHPLVSSLLAYWQSNLFVRRQSNLTLITLTKDAIGHQGLLNDCITNMFETNQSISSNISGRINIPTESKSTVPVETDNLPCDPASLISSGTSDHAHWDEPRLLLDCLLDCFNPIAFGINNSISTEDMYKLLAHLILPCLSNALEREENEIFLGGPPKPFEMNHYDLVHLFVSVLLEDPAVQTCTELRVMYYQMASLFVYHIPNYVHMGSACEQSYRLRKFTEFSRPCLTSSLTAVDLQEKYTGLQLLSHLIAKFNVLRTATVQVFQCLAKGAHTETKKIVNPALDILIPAWIQGPDDQKALALATKKIMLEDHGIQSCVHILGIIVRHSDLYYPIRHQILPHIILIISRLSVQQLPVEQRRLALDMIYTTAQWDVRCRREITENHSKEITDDSNPVDNNNNNLSLTENSNIQTSAKAEPTNSPMDKPQRDQLVNLLIRFACQAIDASQSGSLSEQSVSRTLAQLEFALRSDVWGGETCELRLAFIDRYFTPDDSSSSHSTLSTSSGGVPANSLNTHGIHMSGTSNTTPTSTPSGPHTNASSAGALGATQATSLLMTLEVLRVLFSTLESPTLLINVKHFSVGLCNVLTRQLTNVRLIRSCAGLLRAMLERYPAEASHRQKVTAYPELFDIYSTVLKVIQDSFTMFSEKFLKQHY
ncbi:putative transformation/transcription domain-associated protein [Schistosoma mansoni]|uniref:putative transformation/transcription domain-associated protein n=1 Tax=Schistosoma mansoni TaxID=6183 RepID=UPI00022DCBE1|nr:putative transformation/transcription domain-associated protein [Schistosoma mansoni]|eukprot:XP_018655091.1 putative transformation/transcription domain-associated protein [Schistosoma mansoni]